MRKKMIDPLFELEYHGSRKSKQGVDYEENYCGMFGGIARKFSVVGRDSEADALPTSGRIERPEAAIRGVD